VIAPDGFELPPIVRAEAAQYGTSIRVVPLSYFPASAIGKISQIFWMPTLGRTRGEMDYPIFPEHVHRFFNEPQNRYHHLIPKDWR
jgi:hypothetical protein